MYISKREDIMKTRCLKKVLVVALLAGFAGTASAIGLRKVDPRALGAGLLANYVGEVVIAPRIFNNITQWDNGVDALTDDARKRGGAFMGSPKVNSLDAADTNAKIADSYLQGKVNSATHDYIRATRSAGSIWTPAPGTLYEEFLGKAQKNTPKTLFEPYCQGYKFLKSAFDDKTPSSPKVYDDQVRAEALVSFLTAWKEGPRRALGLGGDLAKHVWKVNENKVKDWKAGLAFCGLTLGIMKEWSKSGINGWHKILLPTVIGVGAGILAKIIQDKLLFLLTTSAINPKQRKAEIQRLEGILQKNNLLPGDPKTRFEYGNLGKRHEELSNGLLQINELKLLVEQQNAEEIKTAEDKIKNTNIFTKETQFTVENLTAKLDELNKAETKKQSDIDALNDLLKIKQNTEKAEALKNELEKNNIFPKNQQFGVKELDEKLGQLQTTLPTVEELLKHKKDEAIGRRLDSKSKEFLRDALSEFASLGLTNLTVDQILPTKMYKALSKDLNGNKIYTSTLDVVKNIIE